VKNEEGGEDQAGRAYTVIPFELFAEVGDRKNGENSERDDFLDGLELRCVEFVGRCG
jgi:hypothetical protein